MTTVTIPELPYVQQQTVYQGATWRKQYRWLPGGTAQNFTGWVARMQIRRAPGDPTLLLALTTANGGITLGVDGLITILATDEQTATLPPRRLAYDLELESPAGEVTRFLMGSAAVSAEVTV